MSQFEIDIQCEVEVEPSLVLAARKAAQKTLAHEDAKKSTSLTLLLAQAREAGHDLTGELCLLVVHGVLHLLDYDHATDGEAQQMGRVQAEILSQLGLADASRLNS